ncbi:MAG TPA: hypothetical protein VL362_00325 [Patescibacteria group bacterium]|jgi:hypothetical protein|nr:hypothetical protein [Patescibacteria group bacterium]
MTEAVAGFFDSLPGWVQATLAVAIGIGTVIIAWKNVIPNFVHEVRVMHKGVKYWRNRPMHDKQGNPQERDPGFYFAVPGLLKYQDTDMRDQTSLTEGFRVDITIEGKWMTYVVDGLSVAWRVSSAFRYQIVNADPERFVIERVREACRALLSNGPTTMSSTDIAAQCRRRIPSLSEIGVELVAVMITSASFETRNHVVMSHDGAPAVKPIIMDES